MGFHPDWNEISAWIKRSERIFIKKLSRNDTSWADGAENGHQNGFFVPRAAAESDFFPELKNTIPEKPHIFDVEYPTFWPASGEISFSTIKYYSKRSPGTEKERPRYEWHHTGVPKEQFQNLSPASLLIVGKLEQAMSGACHWLVAVDSVSEEAEIIETAFELSADFHFGFFEPSQLVAPATELDQLVADLARAIKEGTLEQFIRAQALPTPESLARQAQSAWLASMQLDGMSPFSVSHPGDAVMRVSRDIEYSLYKRAELRFRVAQVARILLQKGEDPLANLVHGFPEIDAIFLSAAQTRKSRAGLSFEHHVERLFRDGRVRYEAQAVFGGRRPDFVLPGVKALNAEGDAVILSLKTTLRERWKQLALEKPLGMIFLATVDDRVSVEAIDEMRRHSMTLVVPESLKKKTNESYYSTSDNVITFKHFFDEEVKAKRPSLILPI